MTLVREATEATHPGYCVFSLWPARRKWRDLKTLHALATGLRELEEVHWKLLPCSLALVQAAGEWGGGEWSFPALNPTSYSINLPDEMYPPVKYWHS